jgi:hypothetical protein
MNQGNTENTLSDIVQEKIAIQDAFTRIENLSHSISKAGKDRQDALRLIKILDEKFAITHCSLDTFVFVFHFKYKLCFLYYKLINIVITTRFRQYCHQIRTLYWSQHNLYLKLKVITKESREQ